MISLFSGIGGIEIGADRAGIETLIQVENNPFCIVILEKIWPQCKRYTDIQDVNLSSFRADFRVRTPAKRTLKGKGSTAAVPVADGARCTELYAKFDQNTCLWKTFQTSLDEVGGKSLRIFTRHGIMFGGALYLLKTSDSLLRENAYTPLLLRPLASDGKRYKTSINALSRRYKFAGQKHCLTLPEIVASRFSRNITPSFYELIMGFQPGHTELPHWVTRVFPFSRK